MTVKRKVWNIPNTLTLFRILAVPALASCFYLKGDIANWLALGIFVLASLTDFLDGYLARAWNQQSALGRMLDPIADKLLVAIALLMLVANHTISGWFIWAAIIILSREIFVSGLREFLSEQKVTVHVTWLAKWKTALQMVALAFLLAGPAGNNIWPYTQMTGLFLLSTAAIVTLYTGYDYFKSSWQHISN